MKLLFCLALALAPASASANCDLSGLREVFGYFFDARTGAVVDSRCVRQPYTFENAILFDFRLESMERPRPPAPPVILSPYAFATIETAREMLKLIEQLAPGSQPAIEERNFWGCPGGPSYTGADHIGICFTHPMRFIRVYTSYANPLDGGRGWPISAGEAANALMRNPAGARKLISDDIERGLGALQRVNGR